jgi:glycosidase
MGQPRFPTLYQIDTRTWLGELSRQLGRAATLCDVPGGYLEQLARLGFDWIWFMGCWQTGAAGRQISRTQADWLREFRAMLPDLRDDDICGSCFAVQEYVVPAALGGTDSLIQLREHMRRQGLRLILDFMPNHTAPDHPWVREHPEYYIHGTEEDLAREPQNYRRMDTGRGPAVLACGRDPYFPGWPDTLQLNYRHRGLREAMFSELLRIAGWCDGLRSDMAMLLLPQVFTPIWGKRSIPADGTPPVDSPFWPEAIGRVRTQFPEFVFMAEVYWDLEWTLQQQGFDYTYDKRYYDRLRKRDTSAARGHLKADPEFQRKLVRFLESHDEPRAASVLPPVVHQAAAVLTFLVPGMRFFEEGQLEGRRHKASVHLCRRPDEPLDPALHSFYEHLLACLHRSEVRDGQWRLLECRAAWEGNATWEKFIVFTWEDEGRRLLVAVNYGPLRGQCYVGLAALGNLRGKKLLLRDQMGPASYERAGDDLVQKGLYLDMPEWAYHVFDVSVG